MLLSELHTGEQAVIVKVRGHGGFRKRILEMGFVRGKTVSVIKNAPLKDPIEYNILDYQVSLRRSEAANIEVISVEEAEKLEENFSYEGVFPAEKVREIAMNKRRTINVAFVGNPNCGKTTLFNVLTGKREHTGNYSGVTIDVSEGEREYKGYRFRIYDLPGTYSLTAFSPEEVFVRNHIINEKPDIIVNVIASSNLERSLYLSTQLIDMDLRMVISLNMYDELEKTGAKLKTTKLSTLLGASLIPTVASKNKGILPLLDKIIEVYEDCDPIRRHIHINYGESLEKSIFRIRKTIETNTELANKVSPRFLAIKLLEKDNEAIELVNTYPESKIILETCHKEIRRIENEFQEDTESLITESKYGFISGALTETLKPGNSDLLKSRKIDKVFTNKYFGFPLFFLILWFIFNSTFTIGAYPVHWINLFTEWLSTQMILLLNPGVLRDLLTQGIIGGVGGVLAFLPNILILYFFISILEDTGYMARAAFIMDRLMLKMGLHGRSFIPMLMGFGCNVPAILATRTIEDKKNRFITILVIPFMSCSARLPVYVLIAGLFFPKHGGLALLGVYLAGIVLAVISARIMKRFVIKGEEAPFVMELPPYRIPSPKTVMIHMWQKGSQYLKKIGGVILAASILIWFLGYFPLQKKGAENISRVENTTGIHQDSYLGKMGKAIEPVIKPLGFNWKIGISLVAGIPAKEIIVSSITVLYSEEDGKLNTKSIYNDLTPFAAFGFMIFVLIYFPCMATLTVIKNETGSWKWPLFLLAYTSFLTYFSTLLINIIGKLLL